MRALTILLLVCLGCGGCASPEERPVMTAGEAMSLPSPAADHRIFLRF